VLNASKGVSSSIIFMSRAACGVLALKAAKLSPNKMEQVYCGVLQYIFSISCISGFCSLISSHQGICMSMGMVLLTGFYQLQGMSHISVHVHGHDSNRVMINSWACAWAYVWSPMGMVLLTGYDQLQSMCMGMGLLKGYNHLTSWYSARRWILICYRKL